MSVHRITVMTAQSMDADSNESQDRVKREGGENVLWRSTNAKLSGSDPISTAAPFWIPLPTSALRESSSVADLGSWYAIGEAWVHVALSQVRTFEPRILDIGCGCGKMARFFSINPRGSYLGLDVFRPSIDWSKQAFIDRPNIRFLHFDVFSPLYNSGGTLNADTTPLPVEDRSADLIICASLFTHLLEPTARHYLKEVRRCLAIGGTAIVSTHNEPAAGTRFSGTDTRIDVADDYFQDLASRAGLKTIKIGKVFGQEVFRLDHV
jgi:SAM-dependent methyltransferase